MVIKLNNEKNYNQQTYRKNVQNIPVKGKHKPRHKPVPSAATAYNIIIAITVKAKSIYPHAYV